MPPTVLWTLPVGQPSFYLKECNAYALLVDTTHNGHAHEIAKTMSLDYDAVITVSGDGLIHEVMNGFANHSDPMKAFAIPIAPIPTGSGNGLSLNLLGIEVSQLHSPSVLTIELLDNQNGFDISIATLNVIKGTPARVSNVHHRPN